MGSTEWRTPQAFFDALSCEFGGFTLDAAATHENALCDVYCTKEGTFRKLAGFNGAQLVNICDGLANPWPCAWRVWVNPPYFPGAALKRWVQKGWESAQQGALVVMLLPVSTDTVWFHSYCWDKRFHRPREGVELRFLEGRLHFSNPEKPDSDSPSGPNLLVIFHPSELAP